VLIDVWNQVTTTLNRSKEIIIIILGSTGMLGFSIQLSALNDLMFVCSFGIFFLYTVFAAMYSTVLDMVST